jgi:hypothetical protein
VSSPISDSALRGALTVYVGLVGRILAHPERWLGVDDEPPPEAGRVRRTLDTIRDVTLGDITPASPRWSELPLRLRTRWWVIRIGASAGVAAAAPRFAGALADRLPLQAALGASAAGLAVCAVAREHGRTDPGDWVPLLARILFDRELSGEPATVVEPERADRDLETAAADTTEPPSTMQALGQTAQRTVRSLWRLARIFLELDNLLDHRPRGNLLARGLAKVPVVGVVGGWLDERGAIRRAAHEAAKLAGGPPSGSPAN